MNACANIRRHARELGISFTTVMCRCFVQVCAKEGSLRQISFVTYSITVHATSDLHVGVGKCAAIVI